MSSLKFYSKNSISSQPIKKAEILLKHETNGRISYKAIDFPTSSANRDFILLPVNNRGFITIDNLDQMFNPLKVIIWGLNNNSFNIISDNSTVNNITNISVVPIFTVVDNKNKFIKTSLNFNLKLPVTGNIFKKTEFAKYGVDNTPSNNTIFAKIIIIYDLTNNINDIGITESYEYNNIGVL